MELSKILLKQGIREEDQGLKDCENVVTDVGFFSFRFLKHVPYLVHFYIDEHKRSPKNFYKQAKVFKDILRKRGYKEFILNSPENGPVARFVEAYVRGKAYLCENGDKYYHTGVESHVKERIAN